MRKLLIFTAGVALLSAPAFAQPVTGSSSADQPATGSVSQPAPDQAVPPPSAAPATPDTAQPSDMQPAQPAAPAQPNYNAQPGTTGVTTPPPSATQGGSRLYTATNENGVQVVANSPVPDTKANRSRFPPLSHAGRRTKAAGN